MTRCTLLPLSGPCRPDRRTYVLFTHYGPFRNQALAVLSSRASLRSISLQAAD